MTKTRFIFVLVTFAFHVFCTAPVTIEASAAEPCEAVLGGKRLMAVVPYAPGGGRDSIMRVVVSELERHFHFSSVSIVNLPGGRYVPAMTAVAEPRSGELTLGIFSMQDIVLPGIDDDARPSRESLPVLGTVAYEPSVWVTRADFSLDVATGRTVILASSTLNKSATHDFLFPAQILGFKPQIISRYDSSSEILAAIARGDADTATLRLTSALAATKSMDLQISLALTEGPLTELPKVPYFGGPGGLAEKMAKTASPEERQHIEKLTAAVIALSATQLTLHTSATYDASTRQCLEQAVTTVIMSEDFHTEAAKFKQAVAGIDRLETEAIIERAVKAYADVESEIQSALVAASQD